MTSLTPPEQSPETYVDHGQHGRSYVWLVLLIFGVVVFGSCFLVFFVINP